MRWAALARVKRAKGMVLDGSNANSHSAPDTARGQRSAVTLVRLRRQQDKVVKVRFRAVKNRAVSNRNCVAAMWGGEQRNENDQSVT